MLKLYGHGGSGNHGCEDIVRSTVGILGGEIELLSQHPERDLRYGIDQVCRVTEDTDTPLKRGSLSWFLSSLETKLTGKYDRYFRYTKEKLMSRAARGDVFLSIGGGKLVMEAYRNLIRRILDTTDLNVVLVPHVVWESNDDRKVLAPLHEEFRSTGRVILLDDHNCTELKGYIARCRMFIGARTHSTIAAYSQCVPTLVLGYSVKSRGIARDLFGSEEHYVIPVQGMTDPRALADGFDWLLKNENDIRVHLEKTMPGYKKQAYNALDALKKL